MKKLSGSTLATAKVTLPELPADVGEALAFLP
jgi:hypothetical protein